MPDPAENGDAGGSDNSNGEIITVSKTAKRSLWLMGLSIILVLYVHTSLAPALTEMVEFFDTDYAVVSWVLTAYMIAGAARYNSNRKTCRYVWSKENAPLGLFMLYSRDRTCRL